MSSFWIFSGIFLYLYIKGLYTVKNGSNFLIGELLGFFSDLWVISDLFNNGSSKLIFLVFGVFYGFSISPHDFSESVNSGSYNSISLTSDFNGELYTFFSYKIDFSESEYISGSSNSISLVFYNSCNFKLKFFLF